MKRYSTYKDSGVKWIGEIPSHWKVKHLSKVATEYFVSNKIVHHQNLLSLSYGNIIRKDINTTEGLLPASFDNYQVVKDGIIILRLTDLQNDHKSLRVGLAHEEGIVTSAYLSLTCRGNITSEYLYEQLHCNDIHKVFYGMGDGLRQSLNWQGLRNLLMVIPPLSEQRAIVFFLDTELGKIDTYMEKELQLIERLKELKQSVIARAVTRGINPNVKMKPSVVNWIGEIPEHWEEKRLSQVATEYFVSNKMVHHQNLLSLSYGKIVRKNINTTEGLLPASFDNYQVVDDGIIVLRLTDLQNDHKSLRVGLAHEEGIVTSAYLSIKPRENITSEYLYEQLHCNDLHKVFYGMGDGLRQSLNWQGLKNLPIVVPPLTEQRAIVDYISSATSKIDKLISEKTKEMEYMKELRKRIISDAVTGKIDVRE